MSVSLSTTRSLSPLSLLPLLALLPIAACGPAFASGASTVALPTVPPAAAAPESSSPLVGAATTNLARAETRRGDQDRKAAEVLYQKALTDIAAATCPARDVEVCAWASGFLAGERPRFGSSEAWTLGTEAIVSDHGVRAAKARFVVFRAKREGNVTSMGTFAAKPDTPAEEADGRAALALVAAEDTTTKNGLLDFILRNLASGHWTEGAFEGKSLYFAALGDRGSLIALRQKGDTLYFAQLIVGGTAAEWDSRPGFVIGSAPIRPLL